MNRPASALRSIRRPSAMFLVRLAGFITGGLGTGVLMLALFLHLSFDGARVEAAWRDFAVDTWQRSASFSQPPQLILWPVPRVRLGALNLSEPARSESFASWNSALLRLDLFALLGGRIVIREAMIDGLQLRLVRDARGDWNFADLLRHEPTRQPFGLQLDSLSLHAAGLDLEDRQSGQSLQARAFRLDSDALGSGASGRLQAEGRILSTRSDLDGSMTLSGRYRLGEDPGSGALSALRLNFSGKLGERTALRAEGSLQTLDWLAEGGQLRNLELTLEHDKERLRLNLPAARWVPGRGEALTGMQAELLEIDCRLADGGQVQIELQKLAGTREVFDAAVVTRLDLPLRITEGESGKLQGQLRATLRHEDRAGRWQLAELQASLDASHPALQRAGGRFTLDGEAHWTPARDTVTESAGWRGRLQSEAAGTLQVDAAVSTGKLTLRLASDFLDLDRVLRPDYPWHRLLPATASVQDWRLDGQLQLASLHAMGIQLEQVASPIELSAGRFSLPGLAAELYGGRLGGSLAWDAASRRYTTSLSLRGVALDTLRRDAGWPWPLAGLGNATLEASGDTGAWPVPCERTSGVLRLYVKDGHWAGHDLAESLRTLAPGQSREGAADEKSPLDELSAAFRFAEAGLQIERLAGRNALLSFTGTGRITCRGELESTLAISPGRDKSLAALGGRRTLLEMRGNWSHATARRP